MAAHSLVQPASLLPDYAQPQHARSPQSVPHGTLQLCTHIPCHIMVKLPRPVNINPIPHPRVIAFGFTNG